MWPYIYNIEIRGKFYKDKYMYFRKFSRKLIKYFIKIVKE